MALQVLRGPFTVETYQRLAELGVLREDDRVELIAGQVVQMTPIGDRHAACVRRANRLFSQAVGDRAIIDVQNPVVLGEQDVPQPDVVLLRPRADAYKRHPGARDTLLVIEVADSSLAYDRDVKVPLYARVGVPEVWVVDVSADRIEVYRQPVAGEYAERRVATRGGALSPSLLPDLTIAANEILGES